MWVLTGFSAELEKNLWLGNFLNLPTRKIRKLDVDAFREEGKRFKFQIHLIIISNCHKQNLSPKIQACNTKIALYDVFKFPYLPMHETEVFSSNFKFT